MSLKVTILKSINSAITNKGMVYPLNPDGTPNRNVGVHINDCSGEWWARLSIDDEKLISSIKDK